MKPIAATIEFTEELSKVLSHGAPLGKALDIISGDLSDKNLRRFFLTGNFEKVNTEKFLQLIKTKPEYFPDEIIHMYQQALKSPDPSKSFKKIIAYMELRKEFQLSTNFLYFSVGVTGLMLLALGRFFYIAFDSFARLYEDLDIDLPLFTQIFISITKMFGSPVYSGFFLFCFIILVAIYLKREWFIRFLLKIPILNKMIIDKYSAYSCNCLASLLSLGFSPAQAVNMLKKQKEMAVFEDYLRELESSLEQSENSISPKIKIKLLSDYMVTELIRNENPSVLAAYLMEEASGRETIVGSFSEKAGTALRVFTITAVAFFIIFVIISLLLPLHNT